MQADMCAFNFGYEDRDGRGWFVDMLEAMARGLTGDAKTTSSFRMLSHMCIAHASLNLPQHGVKGNGCGEALLDMQPKAANRLKSCGRAVPTSLEV